MEAEPRAARAGGVGDDPPISGHAYRSVGAVDGREFSIDFYGDGTVKSEGSVFTASTVEDRRAFGEAVVAAGRRTWIGSRRRANPK